VQNIRVLLIFIGLTVFSVAGQAQTRLSDLEPFSHENIQSFGMVARLEYPSDELQYADVIALNQNATILAAGNSSGQLWYWDLSTGEATILNAVVNCDCPIEIEFVSGFDYILQFSNQTWDLNTNTQLEDRFSDNEENSFYPVFNDVHLLLDPLSLVNAETGDTICEFFPAYQDTIVLDRVVSDSGEYLALSVNAYNHVNFRFPIYTANVYNDECEIVAWGGDENGTSATDQVSISQDNRYFAYSVYGDNVYITTIPNEFLNNRIDTTLKTGVFVFNRDSQLLIVGNSDGVWAYDLEAQQPHLLDDLADTNVVNFEFYDDNLIIVPTVEEGVLLFGIIPE
jgi:hypothetical protein